MSATKKNRTAMECFKLFEADVGSLKYTVFKRESILARAFMEDNFRMSDLGFFDDDKPWVKKNSIRKTVNQAYSKIMLRPPRIMAAPYEGFNVEQDLSKVCECIWKYEESEPRTGDNLKMNAEVKKSGRDAFIEGCGYVDSRIDDTIGSSYFPNGKAVYERFRPLNIVIDKGCDDWNKKQHVHIVHWVSPEMIKLQFGKDIIDIRSTDDEYSDVEKTGGDVRVIETQYKEEKMTRLYKLAKDQMLELGIKEPYIWEEDLREAVEALKIKTPELYEFMSVKNYLKNTEKVRRSMRTGWFSIYHLQGKELHAEPFYQGVSSTLTQLCPFPADNSPYGHGLPFFMTATAKIEMILGTQAIRSILARRAYMLGKPSKDFENKWNKNALNEIFVLEGDMIDPDRSIKEQVDFEDNSQKAPFLFNAWQMMQGETVDEYGDMSAGLPSDTSRYMVNHIRGIVSDMMSVLMDATKTFYQGIYDRSLRLALMTIPQPMLYILAGENDEERMKLILTGELYQRLEIMNAQVVMDDRPDEIKMVEMQIIGELLKVGKIPIGKGGEMLGMSDSYELEKIQDQQMMKMNPLMAMAKQLQEDPVAMTIWQNYLKQKEIKKAAKQIENN